MSAMVGADPLVLDDFVAVAHDSAERQRRAVRRLEVALEMARRGQAPVVASAETVRSLRAISTGFEALASDVTAAASAFRSADRVLSTLGPASTASAAVGGSAGIDVPMPGTDWELSWTAPGFPHAEWSWSSDRLRVDLDAGIGPRVEASAGVGIVSGVVNLGAELDVKVGAWARAAVASGFGPLVSMASGEVFVGAQAGARVATSIGRNGVLADMGAEAFAGAKASGEASVDLGPAGVGASGAVTAGIGAKADLDVALSFERMALRYDFGATLGLGFELGGEWHIEPRSLYNGVVDLGEDLSKSAVVRSGAAVVDGGIDAGVSVAKRAGGFVSGAVGLARGFG